MEEKIWQYTITFLLIVTFHIKHYLADFLLQTPYMLKKHLPDWDYVKPLAAHCGVHALFTCTIACTFLYLTLDYYTRWEIPLMCLKVSLIDFICHFIVDRLKASPASFGRFTALSVREFPEANERKRKENRNYWFVLGADQELHHLTNLFIAWLLLTWKI